MRYQIKAYALNWQLVPNVFIQLTNTTPVLIRVFDKSKIAGMYKKNIVNWTPVKDYFELRMIIKEALNKM